MFFTLVYDSDMDPKTNIFTRIFFLWCLSMHAFIWDLEPVRPKMFSNRKKYIFFLFQVLDLLICINSIQQCLDPYPNPNFYSDSDPAKSYGFVRIRIRIYNSAPGGTATLPVFILMEKM
jgi:hypothetical protein